MASTQLTPLFVLLLFIVTSADPSSGYYRAATVHFEPFNDKHMNPTDILLVNAKRYVEYAKKAAQEKAIIVVFPEYGLTALQDVKSRSIAIPFTQTIPDPKKVSWNPCLNPTDFNQTEALHVISCSASDNSIAILANILSREDCSKEDDPDCPSDSHYISYTNVVFDKTGTLIARYHKKHLFFEKPILDTPEQAEYVTFNIEGIEFASFTSWDMMYKDPAVDLVREHGIKNIIFSTAWDNQMPFLLGPHRESSWARGLGVNLIVSNYFIPHYSRLGAGIYSSQLGALNETFDIKLSKDKLLTADVPIDPGPVPEESKCLAPIQSQTDNSKNKPLFHFYKIIHLTNKPSSSAALPTHTILYQSLRNFATHYLNESQGNVTLCHKNACCNLVYDLTRNNDLGVYALMAFDGMHHFYIYGFGMQTCSVMRCEHENDVESCGRVPKTKPAAIFDKLSLTAQLEADVVFPSVVQGDLQMLSAKDWSFSLTNCEGNKSQSKIELTKAADSILIASLYARLYDRDRTYIMQR